jgi:hypothetical protein
VGSRDCTKLVDGVLKQVDVVRGVLGNDVPVLGVLCFVEADWPLIGGNFTTRGVQAYGRKSCTPNFTQGGRSRSNPSPTSTASSQTLYPVLDGPSRRNDAQRWHERPRRQECYARVAR